MFSRDRRLKLERLEDRLVLDGSVAFNEIMYHPPGNDFTLEWVELTNLMSVDMELSNWALSGAVEYVFPEGTTLASGQFLVVAASSAALEVATGFGGALGGWTGRLENAGETIELRDNNWRLIDQVAYTDDGDWPVGPDGGGPSLAKIDPEGGSVRFENWESGQIGGSPGMDNRQADLACPDCETLLPMDANWKYNQSNVPQPATWKNPGFDDSSWQSGQALLYVESSSLPAAKTRL